LNVKMQPIPGTTVIGVGHKARQGKDTLANWFLDNVKGTRRYSFADDLKAFARVLGMREKNAPLLQALGSEVFRSLNSDIWIECLYARLLEERPRVAIIPDCRFPNEAALVQVLNGIMVKVSRLNPDGTPFIAADRPATHPSECALDTYAGWDCTVTVPSGKLDTLYTEAQNIATFLKL
jgi:hypothetical protein